MGREHVCTYRLQLNANFGFDDAARVVDYLAKLGVSHVYLSPIAQAAPGSMHGYDVCDPAAISADLGGPEAYERFCQALDAAGLGQIIDIVPNHMAVALPQNRWLDDVLRHGPASRYAAYFDLQWAEADDGTPYIELPFLGDEYDSVLAAGDVRLLDAEDGPRIQYGDFRLPLRPGTEPSSTDLTRQELDALLQQQHYRLVDWRRSSERLSYRRFFDVATLIGVHVEDPGVFEDTHALPLGLARSGRVEGLRIDHIDGLRDPEAYLRRLREGAPDARILVEKILAPEETLPDTWPVDGSTGYDFLAALHEIFVDSAAEHALTRFYADFAGQEEDFARVLVESKRAVIERLFNSEVSQLAALLREIAGDEWSLEDCHAVLGETLVAFPVYRTYVRSGTEPSAADRGIVGRALASAGQTLDSSLAPLLELLGEVLLLRHPGNAVSELAMRFQQISGPVMAKGAEDTSFYRYNRLVSLNEVGGEPSRFGGTVDRFHAYCSETSARWPLTMLTTATHDTKRGEDTRLRISALSQIPDEWIEAVRRWSALNEPLREAGLPDRNTEYLFYQTLVGAWPLSAERAWAYMFKAVHEAKMHTSWRYENQTYEAALRDFVEGSLAGGAFIEDVEAFAGRVAALAEPMTLAQTLIKLTAPGVPDIYQGCELLDLSLVDPDNRRPVDYEKRREMLETALELETAQEVVTHGDPDMTKLWLTQRALQARREHLDAFSGDYVPLSVEGNDALVVFARGGKVICVAQTRGTPFGNLELPAGHWRNVLTGETLSGRVSIWALLSEINVALLVREDAA